MYYTWAKHVESQNPPSKSASYGGSSTAAYSRLPTLEEGKPDRLGNRLSIVEENDGDYMFDVDIEAREKNRR